MDTGFNAFWFSLGIFLGASSALKFVIFLAWKQGYITKKRFGPWGIKD